MQKIIQMEKKWQDVTSEKAELTWQHQLWLRDKTLGRNCEVELARATKRQEDLASGLRMARVRRVLECVVVDEEELEFFQAEINEISDAYVGACDFQSLINSLTPQARECLIDWVNIHGYPDGGSKSCQIIQ